MLCLNDSIRDDDPSVQRLLQRGRRRPLPHRIAPGGVAGGPRRSPSTSSKPCWPNAPVARPPGPPARPVGRALRSKGFATRQVTSLFGPHPVAAPGRTLSPGLCHPAGGALG